MHEELALLLEVANLWAAFGYGVEIDPGTEYIPYSHAGSSVTGCVVHYVALEVAEAEVARVETGLTVNMRRGSYEITDNLDILIPLARSGRGLNSAMHTFNIR